MSPLTPSAAPHFDAQPAEVLVYAEREEDALAVDDLIERAFGPGRYAKTAERLREGNHPELALSFCAFGAGALVGAVRQWPILVGETPALFLGPIAVEAAWRKHGVGGKLIRRSCEAAAAAGVGHILLVGDAPLFGPHGFVQVPAGRIVLPGPVNPSRLLWRELREGALDGVFGPVMKPRS